MTRYEEKNGKDKPTRKPLPVGGGYNATFRGYVNLLLSPAEKELFDKWRESSSFWDMLQAAVEDGINISLKLDPKGSGYLASATQRRETSVNAGLVVTARARDAATAWGRLLFCLVILGKQERWEATQPISDPDRW